MLRGRGRQGWLNKRRQSGQTDWWASNDVNNCRADSKIVYPTAHAPLNRWQTQESFSFWRVRVLFVLFFFFLRKNVNLRRDYRVRITKEINIWRQGSESSDVGTRQSQAAISRGIEDSSSQYYIARSSLLSCRVFMCTDVYPRPIRVRTYGR